MIILTKTHEQFIRELHSKNDKVTIIGKYVGQLSILKLNVKDVVLNGKLKHTLYYQEERVQNVELLEV